MPLTETIGAATLDGLAYVGGLARLIGGAIRAVFILPFQGKKFHIGRAIHQAMSVGVEALPITSLISFFVGTILAVNAAYELRKLGALHFVASGVAIAITRELGPLMTAIVVIGRSGSAFAAEIGTMKVNEEIDAMETMALEPVQFLVAPKFLAMVLMVPCLTCWADFMGVIGGGVFGVVITAVGCQEGFSTGLGSEQVGRSTTSAVVKSIFLVVMVDLIFTTIFYVTSPR